MNSDLEIINNWLACNKLSLNINKTKYIVFHSKHRKVIYPSSEIENILIEKVCKFNYLGLLMHENAKWNFHIDYVSRKVSRVIGILYSLKNAYPSSILLTLYNTLALPSL